MNERLSNAYGYCIPGSNSRLPEIHINIDRILSEFPSVSDVMIDSIYLHEFKHLLDWYTICHKDINVWRNDNTLENVANEFSHSVISIMYPYMKDATCR